jgi:hypothetical protein
MDIQTAFLWSCLIIGVGSMGLTAFALSIRRKHEHDIERQGPVELT